MTLVAYGYYCNWLKVASFRVNLIDAIFLRILLKLNKTFKSNSISQKFTFNFIEILFLMPLNGNLQRGVNFTKCLLTGKSPILRIGDQVLTFDVFWPKHLHEVRSTVYIHVQSIKQM